jgi:large subunit ribosomal protein L10
MSKAIKQMQMDSLKTAFDGVRDLVLLNVVGLPATTDNAIRLGLRKKGIRLQVVKNTLARRVLSDMGVTVDKGWAGSTTVAWGGASIADLSKEIEEVVKKNDKTMTVKTAVADGQEVAFDIALKMPTREQAIARVVMLALSPASRLASQILGPAAQLVGQIQGIKDMKKDEAPAADAAAPATA